MESFFVVIFASSTIFAQNVDKNDLEFEYIRLPLKPIEKTTKNYDVLVFDQVTEAKNAELKAKYDVKKKEADDDYNKKIAEKEAMINSQKSKAASLLMSMAANSKDNKIVKAIVPEPLYLSVFPKETIGAKLDLKGYSKSAQNAVKITINILGFDYTDMIVNKGGKDPEVYYYVSFQYRNPISAKIEYNGKVYMDEAIAKSNDYLNYTSGNFKSEYEANTYLANNTKSIAQKIQNESMDKSMKDANEYINFNYGYVKLKREGLLYSVKNKKGDYNDFSEAYSALSEGFMMLGEDLMMEDGKTKIKQAIEKFEVILKESSITDKKARVNQDVTVAAYFNLLEANVWVNEFITLKNIF